MAVPKEQRKHWGDAVLKVPEFQVGTISKVLYGAGPVAQQTHPPPSRHTSTSCNRLQHLVLATLLLIQVPADGTGRQKGR